VITTEDRLEILELYGVQSHAVDGGDGEAWAATYAEDGVFESPTYQLTARGRDELRAFAENSNGAALARGEQFRHVVTGIVLDEIEEGRVRARAYMTILATTAEGSRVDRSLVVHDELVRVAGSWLFRERKVYRD